MPATLSYPGVYIEEIPSGVRTITGVATSVAAFIDYFSRGPTNKPVHIFSMADFDREFGGLAPNSEGSYAVQQFFLNGGTEAWVVRVVTTGDTTTPANNAVAASVQIAAAIAGGNALLVTAISEGAWGGNLRANVDINGVAAGEFNLTITEVSVSGGRVSVVRQEIFRNLSMLNTKTNFADKVVNDNATGSKLVRVTASGTTRPLANGTFSGSHTANPIIPASPRVVVTIGTEPAATIPLNLPTGAQPLTVIAPALEAAIRAASPASPAFAGATVGIVGDQLFILAGGANAANIVTFVNATGPANSAANILKLIPASGVIANSQAYVFGGGVVASTAQLAGVPGANGALPGSTAFIGDLVGKRGIFALEEVDLFNILCLPRAAIVTGPDQLSATQAQALISVSEGYCEKRRAFLLLDTPSGVDEPQEITNWLQGNGSLRHRNAALFYPRVRVPDPLDDFRLRSFGASGTVAGVFARTDSTRGVWKAPAGTEAVTRNVSELEDVLSDMENGALNPLAINCLRNFPVYGNIVWGSRTLDGSDQQASEWKYISVRRTALFLEESLYRGTQWVVFEPNDEPLWAQIRLNLGAFMHNLFRQGAFQGMTPKEAYFVKCDKETTTQTDINLGIVNIVVGFAPLKPAEFVVIKIQQMAGQIEV